MLVYGSDIYKYKYTVYDCEGKQIPHVYSYDTETKEISIYIEIPIENSVSFISNKSRFLKETRNSDEDGYKLVTFILEGSYILDGNGNRI